MIMDKMFQDQHGNIRRTYNISQRDDIVKKLLNWYYHHQRHLEWRSYFEYEKTQSVNPYHVWISEIMLQQTTVATIKKRFSLFIQQFPNIKILAQASRDDVLSAWAGLGYYARARNLHDCAQKLWQQYNGNFPQTKPEIITLPGIGDYTASAISSIAFQQPHLAIDTNIKRVLARLFADDNAGEGLVNNIKKNGAFLSNHRYIGAINQALMDIGADICLAKKKPLCAQCPLENYCQGKAEYQKYPFKAVKKQRPYRHGHVVLIESHDNNAILLYRQHEKSVYGGMWLFPHYGWLDNDNQLKLPFEIGEIKDCQFSVKHIFTHFSLNAKIYHAQAINDMTLHNHPHYRWCSKNELLDIGMPSLMVKIWKKYHDACAG